MTMQAETGFVPKKMVVRRYQSKPAHPESAKALMLAGASGPPVVFGALGHSDAAGDRYYDPRAADALAEIAGWAYSDYLVLTDALQHRGILDPEASVSQVSIKNEAMLVVSTAFFIRSGDVGVICFRGTEPSNAINFLTDASCRPVNFYSMGKVHGGFYRNVRAVWPDVATEVEEAISSGLRALYITGHSLGAAMAAIAGALVFGDGQYAHWRPLVQGIYTYGQPMVGDADFARSCERIENILFRHVYGHDLVPRLPPLTTGSFVHFGKEYHGGEDGWSPRSRMSTQVASISLSVPISVAAWAIQQLPLLSWIRLPLSVDDHSPNNYLEGFRAARS
jgi:hypothetical protein